MLKDLCMKTFKTLMKEIFKRHKGNIFHIYWLEELILLIHPFYPQLSTYSLQSLKISKLFTKQTKKFYNLYKTVVVVQLPGHVWLFVTSQPATHQTSLFLTCPRICPSSCPLNWWCLPTISSSFTLFFFCLQSFQASGSFPMSQLFTLGGQSIGDSGSASVLPKSYMGLISFKVDWFSTPWCPRDSQESSTEPQLENISSSAFCFLYCLPSSYMCTWLLERA